MDASRAAAEGHQLAEKLRQEGLARARSIIAKAEREAQAAIRSAQEAAEAAESQARGRAEATLAGKPLPAIAEQGTPRGESAVDDGTIRARISALPSDGSTLRYRINAPLGFAGLLHLKRDVAQLPGVSNVNVVPAEQDDAVLSLKANASEETWQRLISMPIFVEASV